MPRRFELTHETPVKKFLHVEGMEGKVNLDGILKNFGIKPLESVAKVHAERPDSLKGAKEKISDILGRFAPVETFKLFENTMQDRYPQLAELSRDVPAELTRELSELAKDKIDMTLIDGEKVDEITEILGKHSSFGKASLRISQPVSTILRSLRGEHQISTVTEKLIDSVKDWVPLVSYEKGEQINPQENAGRELIQYLSSLQ